MTASILVILLVVGLISVHAYSFQKLKLTLVPRVFVQNSLNFNTLTIKGANDDSIFGSEFVNNKNKKKTFPKPGSNGRGNAEITDQEWAELQQIKKQSKQCKKYIYKSYLY